MMHTAFQRIQIWFGWCPNHPGIHAQTQDHMTQQFAPGLTNPESPQPDTPKATITVDHWMTGGALAILVATCFVGGNIWWPFFVGVMLFACLVYWHYSHGREAR